MVMGFGSSCSILLALVLDFFALICGMGVFFWGLTGEVWMSDSTRNWDGFLVGSKVGEWRDDKLTDLVLGRLRRGSGSGWVSLE